MSTFKQKSRQNAPIVKTLARMRPHDTRWPHARKGAWFSVQWAYFEAQFVGWGHVAWFGSWSKLGSRQGEMRPKAAVAKLRVQTKSLLQVKNPLDWMCRCVIPQRKSPAWWVTVIVSYVGARSPGPLEHQKIQADFSSRRTRANIGHDNCNATRGTFPLWYYEPTLPV